MLKFVEKTQSIMVFNIMLLSSDKSDIFNFDFYDTIIETIILEGVMNSFFSALAGATGGLIGVISAFLISKILSREERFLIIEEKVELAIIKAEEYKQLLGESNMELFVEESREKGINNSIINILSESELNILGESKNIISNLFSCYFSKYDDFNAVSKLINKKREELKELDRDALYSEICKTQKGNYNPYAPYNFSEELNSNDSEDIFEKYRIKISGFKKTNEFLSKKTNAFSKEKKQINFFMIIVSLFFIVGIIYPLSFLKYSENTELDYSFNNNFFYELNSMSGIILFIISIIFLSFIARMSHINNKLYFSEEKLEEFNQIYTFEYYSIYLKNYEDNQIRIKEEDDD